MNKDLNELVYDSLIEKSIKKTRLELIYNPTRFVRGITTELSNDIRMIKNGAIPKTTDKETLNRLKYICELSLSKMSDRRKKLDSDPNSYIKDHFTEYQDALKAVQSLLKVS